MKTSHENDPSPEAQRQWETLQQAVTKALEKKRRLGQYAVVWRDGKPVLLGEDAPRSKEPAL
ncbi:MAG: hypothetical protein JG774_1623 [Desulfomicrobiaceae bacterium]|jgi:hypothetical protein|uniref:hypothetical protein n=1 Tax=Thermodesulfomicrobium sp. WS TaxID=3004129 RepID=UPI0019A54B07|nr:hypothetical protein [Thermodesulfomicrobium sp. WS]MBC7355400.1 hypothetical protein [Desulfomicrobiaceae bacterium]MBZ4648280.1 hypothetical protein [Desulfomicrobiaceae bacterium]MBZ4685878.1 hypothetical protein [Desulfomicrobiaceae bacterium]MDK2872876.1 hypothetical protein [Desulfomicrobiaceae bacterium]BDV01742.1 hypothetical protein TDMWS_18270 [Thermodesulfomicrobium sp. WS]